MQTSRDGDRLWRSMQREDPYNAKQIEAVGNFLDAQISTGRSLDHSLYEEAWRHSEQQLDRNSDMTGVQLGVMSSILRDTWVHGSQITEEIVFGWSPLKNG